MLRFAGNYKCCQILLEQGANAKLCMDNGWTAAHCAAEIGHLDILKLLKEYSALMSVADECGTTPKDLARIYGHKDCVQFLHE